MKKKLPSLIIFLISAFLCAVGLSLCCGCAGGRSYYDVFSDGVLEYGGYIEEVYGEEPHYEDLTLIGVVGNPTEITIPENVNGVPVSAISADAFKDCKSLESINISAGVNKIPNGIFRGCDNLTNIEIAEDNSVYCSRGNCIIETKTDTVIAGCRTSVIVETVKIIGRSAFTDCVGLVDISLPESVKDICESAFYNCSSLESIGLSSLRKIEDNAFGNCRSLKAVNLPSTLTYIGAKAFYGCESLTQLTVPDSVLIIGNSAFADCAGIKSAEISNQKTQVGEGILSGCVGLESITVAFSEKYPQPEVNGNITEFGYFFGKEKYSGGKRVEQAENVYYLPVGLKRVTVTGTVIYGGAFLNCSQIEEVTVTESVTQIREEAFYSCCGLKSVKVESCSTQINNSAFFACTGIEYAELPAETFKNLYSAVLKSVKIIGGEQIPDEAFKGQTKLQEVIIAESVTKIGAEAFSGCKMLTEITVPAAVSEVGWFAFYNCNALKEVVWNAEKCKTNGNPFLSLGSINSFILGESVKEIPDGLCYGLEGIKNIAIPHGVTQIGKEAFAYCSELVRVEIPATVTAIEVDAFKACNKLKEVCLADLSAWCGIDFAIGSNDTVYSNPLYLAEGLYLNGEPVTDLVIPEGVKEIKKYAFDGFEGFISVTLPKSLISIDDRAFYGCSAIKKVCISDFTAWCAINFKTVVGTNPLSYASEGLYINGVKPSANFVIEEGVTRIPDYTFRYGVITAVTLPKSLKSIGEEAFLYCDEIKEVFISDFVAWCELEMASAANPMYKASNLYLNGQTLSGEFTVPDGVTKIPESTFKGSKVTKVTFPKGIKYLGAEIFCNCKDLVSVIIPDGVDKIEERVFMWCYSFRKVYFGGTEDKWLSFNINFHNSLSAKTYFYSEEQPAEADKYWHYIDGEVAVW